MYNRFARDNVIPSTMRKRTNLVSLLLGLVALALVAGACGSSSDQGSAAQGPAAPAAPAVSTAPVISQQLRVPEQPLVALWSAWDILKDDFIDKKTLNPQALTKATTEAVYAQAGEPLEEGAAAGPRAKPPKEVPKELTLLWDQWASLYENHDPSRQLDDTKLGQEAIRAFVKALQDPHTEYVVPEQYPTWSQDFYGNYGGIGANVYSRGGKTILTPMPGSPAAEAGIKAGDTLLAVEGESVDGWSLDYVVYRVRGKKGTEVALTVLHLGADQPVTVRARRDTITLESVFWNMTNDQLAYLNITFFYENTPNAVKAALREIASRGAKGVVLDLRNNPGGFLRATVDVASQFLDKRLVVYEIDSNGKRTDWESDNEGLAHDLPLVVLVNQFSASGSEVLSGALQDYGHAKLVGVTTFGKGSVNLFRPLPDGGGLYYTTARWYTPYGRQIEGKGLAPDLQVIGTTGGLEGDTQLDRALELLRLEAGAAVPAP
ncbi:MAG: S41 family peptidase [Dehalococcoidia bacterium]|nr:S41 family peptidase [Dehalococcoidia bacterium]